MSTPDRPPTRYLDRKRLASEYGFTRATVDRVFREVPTTILPGSGKPYVRRADVDALLARFTWRDDGSSVRRVA